jgi:hypothetical protein
MVGVMIVASRVLKLRDANGEREIGVRICRPEQDDGAWLCRYEIDWPDGTKGMSVGGFDAMQSLVGALQIVGAEIYASDYHKSGNLYWDAPGNGYGFPVVGGVRDLLQGDDLKYL